MIKTKLTLDQMIEAQQRSDIQRATASLAALKLFRVQNEKHYKDRELEERFSKCDRVALTYSACFLHFTGEEKKFGNL